MDAKREDAFYQTTKMSTVTFEIKTSIFYTEKYNVPLHVIHKKLVAAESSVGDGTVHFSLGPPLEPRVC